MSENLTKREIASILREYSFVEFDERRLEDGGCIMLHNTNIDIDNLSSEIDTNRITEIELRQNVEALRLTESRLKTLLDEEEAELKWFATTLFKGTEVELKSDTILPMIKKLAMNMKEITDQSAKHYVLDGETALYSLTNIENIELLLKKQKFD